MAYSDKTPNLLSKRKEVISLCINEALKRDETDSNAERPRDNNAIIHSREPIVSKRKY